MSEQEIEVYTYETKCRRCGNIVNWYFADAEKLEWKYFEEAMNDNIEHPRIMACKPCERQTIQDVVAYGIE